MRAIAFEVLDHEIGLLRHVVPEDRRALRRQHARDIGQVLDRHRQAGEQAAFAGRLLHQRPGVVRARSKHSVGSALTLPSTSAMRFSSASSSSSGETSPASQLVDDRAGRAVSSDHVLQTIISTPVLHFSASGMTGSLRATSEANPESVACGWHSWIRFAPSGLAMTRNELAYPQPALMPPSTV